MHLCSPHISYCLLQHGATSITTPLPPSHRISINNRNTFCVPCSTITRTYLKLPFVSVKEIICRWKLIFCSVCSCGMVMTIPEMIVTVKSQGFPPPPPSPIGMLVHCVFTLKFFLQLFAVASLCVLCLQLVAGTPFMYAF